MGVALLLEWYEVTLISCPSSVAVEISQSENTEHDPILVLQKTAHKQPILYCNIYTPLHLFNKYFDIRENYWLWKTQTLK